MELETWLRERGGIVHRSKVRDARFSDDRIRRAVRSGEVEVIRRAWLAIGDADSDLVVAARAGGRVACVSLARRRGWWLPETVGGAMHLHVAPNAAARTAPTTAVRHWTTPLIPAASHRLVESIEDALAHIATCQPRETALVLWESAMRMEKLHLDAVRSIRWRSTAARRLAAEVRGLSDSGLETLFIERLSPWGLSIRQQIVLAGRPVDALVDEYLVVQIDGFTYHSSSADRTRDLAHDAELRLRGYTVLRFSYAQVLHDWRSVERIILRAVAAGLHTHPAGGPAGHARISDRRASAR